MDLSLVQLYTGIWARVISVDTPSALTRRLRDFGLVPGTRVRRRYASPAGDVIAVEFRSCVLALRSRDAERIRVNV